MEINASGIKVPDKDASLNFEWIWGMFQTSHCIKAAPTFNEENFLFLNLTLHLGTSLSQQSNHPTKIN